MKKNSRYKVRIKKYYIQVYRAYGNESSWGRSLVVTEMEGREVTKESNEKSVQYSSVQCPKFKFKVR